MDIPNIPVGLIGFGAAGRTFHAPVIRSVPGLQLTKILQRNGDSAQQAYPDITVVRDLDALLNDTTIRLIVVATPNDTHHDLAERCLLAGRDVVSDKPFTTTSQEARNLIDIATSQGRLLTVHQNRRWDGDFLTVRDLLAKGGLGRLVLLESHFDRYRPAVRPGAWRERAAPGSGILFDLGSHLIDQALVLFGMPQAITADVRAERDHAIVDDAFDLVLHYSKLRAVLRATMLATAPSPRFLLNGTLGTYTKYGLDPQEDALKAGRTPNAPGWGEEDPSAWGTLTLAEDTGFVQHRIPTRAGDYRQFYGNVRDAIALGTPLAVTAEQAARTIHLIELAQESSLRRATIQCSSEID